MEEGNVKTNFDKAKITQFQQWETKSKDIHDDLKHAYDYEA